MKYRRLVMAPAVTAACLGFFWTPPTLALGPVNVLERAYNRFRTGANTSETILTPANVKSGANRFHKQFVMSVDGKIEGSPLYASQVQMAGGVHNVLYVATMHNSVFAFDADNGAQLSKRSLGTPVTGADLHLLKPYTIHSEFGVASTPVIDAITGTLYVVRWGVETSVTGPRYRLFGLDITDLTRDKFPSVLLDGYNVNGTVFDRRRQMQRAGLVLVRKPNGAQALIVAFAGGEGLGGASGWVLAFDTAKLAAGTATANAWCTNPRNNFGSGGGAGVWMANAAPAVDDNGDIYFATGNGPYNPQFGLDQLGESAVRLVWTPGNPGSLLLADWFTPFLDRDRDDFHRDQDLASGGVIAMPDEPSLIVGGKDGVYYHVNRAAMGRRDFTKLVDQPFIASFNYTPFNGHTSLFQDLNQVTSTDPFTIAPSGNGRTPHIHGTGVYFNNLLFLQGENNPIHVFVKKNGHITPTPLARGTSIASSGSASPGGMPGGILSLSANGTANAILWVNEAFGNLPIDPDSNQASTPNILRAYDVSTVSSGILQSIWDSEAEPNDHLGAATKFAPPLVANGKVYQATYDRRIVVYGLGAPSPTPVRDIRRTVVFIRADPGTNQIFLRGGTKGGGPIRIQHRNWRNWQTNVYRWGDAYLDWAGGELGQATPTGGAGGSPIDWTTSLAQGQNQPFVWTAGKGIADENTFGPRYWMLDVDMDCEQAFDDGAGRRWFELKAFVAPAPGFEGDIAQTSTPAPPYPSKNHMGICGMVNVFVANYPNHPTSMNPNAARFLTPGYTYRAPVDERNATSQALDETPCVAPGIERRCLGNIAQICQTVNGGQFFRSVQNCTATPAGGNFVQMCQPSTGRCCTPTQSSNCQ
jgi:hypothetical protein